jgi:IS1 family transposase/transposase-like protein
MVSVPVQCPYCQNTEVIKAGKQANGAQRYQCQNGQCARRIFLLQYQDRGRVPEIRHQVVDMAINGSGIRDTARVLRISPTTVIAVLKKASTLQPTNRALVPPLCSRTGTVRVNPRRAAALDEMWSCVGTKATPRWLWHAIDHHTGRVLAYVVGTRKEAVFLKLRALLAPFGITHYYTDKAGVYQRHLPPEQHTVGKLSMQKIERKHLTLRTRLKRLARKTLCFSRSRVMHDLLIGLYMNRVEFGCPV